MFDDQQRDYWIAAGVICGALQVLIGIISLFFTESRSSDSERRSVLITAVRRAFMLTCGFALCAEVVIFLFGADAWLHGSTSYLWLPKGLTALQCVLGVFSLLRIFMLTGYSAIIALFYGGTTTIVITLNFLYGHAYRPRSRA